MNDTTKKILGWVVIAFVVVLSFTLIKRLPPIMKVLVFGADIFVIYYSYIELIAKTNAKKSKKSLED